MKTILTAMALTATLALPAQAQVNWVEENNRILQQMEESRWRFDNIRRNTFDRQMEQQAQFQDRILQLNEMRYRIAAPQEVIVESPYYLPPPTMPSGLVLPPGALGEGLYPQQEQ